MNERHQRCTFWPARRDHNKNDAETTCCIEPIASEVSPDYAIVSTCDLTIDVALQHRKTIAPNASIRFVKKS